MSRLLHMPPIRQQAEQLKLAPVRALPVRGFILQSGRMFDATLRRDQSTGVYMIGAPLRPRLHSGRKGAVLPPATNIGRAA